MSKVRQVPKYTDYLEANPAAQFLGRLDLLCKARGWSETELARKIGTPRKTLGGWRRQPTRIPTSRVNDVELALKALCLGPAQDTRESESWILRQLEGAAFVEAQKRAQLFERVAGHCAVQLASSIRDSGIPVNLEEVSLGDQSSVQVVLKDGVGVPLAQVVFLADEFTLRYKAFQRQADKPTLVFEGAVDYYALGFCHEFFRTLAGGQIKRAEGLEKKIDKKINDYYKQQRIGAGFRNSAP